MNAGTTRAPILLTGGRGMLGSAFAEILGPVGIPLGHGELDICDETGVASTLERTHPGLVINCAAATDVDRCERDPAYARTANVDGPAVLAAVCARHGIDVVHVSTDYVFDGEKVGLYTEEDRPRPLGYYGRTKLEGEEAVIAATSGLVSALIVRTSWLFGPRAPEGGSFPDKVLSWASGSRRIRVVGDQWGSPTYTPFLAQGILDLVATGARGVYHLAGDGCASRLDIARQVAALAGLDVEIASAGRDEFPAPAPRPERSCLDCTRAALVGVRLPAWSEGLRRYLVELLGVEPPSSDRDSGSPGGSTLERHPDLS